MQLAIELRAIRAVIKHRQIVGVDPVLATSQLFLNRPKELRAGKWVRDGDTDIIRGAIPDQLNRLFDVVAGLSRVAELEEEANLDSSEVQPASRFGDVFDPGTFLHGVEDFLRAGFGAKPHGPCAGSPKCLDGVSL